MNVWLLVIGVTSTYNATGLPSDPPIMLVRPTPFASKAACLAAAKQITMINPPPSYAYTVSYFCVQGVVVQKGGAK